MRDPRLWLWLAVILGLAAIELAVARRVLSPAVFAQPSEIVVRCWQMLVHEGFWRHLASTTGLSIVGTAVGFPLGCAIAIAIALLGRAETVGGYLLDFIRSIPLTTLVPVFLTIYGIGGEAKVAIASVAAALATAVTVRVGLQAASHARRDLLHLLRPPLPKRLFSVLLVEALPSMIAALRLSTSTALILVVVAEMFIGTRYGVGKVVLDKGYTDDRAGQFAAILAIGIVGFLMNLALTVPGRVQSLRRGDSEGSVPEWL